MRTVILAKYEYGFIEVASSADTSLYTKTVYMDFGRTKSYTAVVTAATAKLAELGVPRESITVGPEPTGAADGPLEDVVIGDAVRSYGADGNLSTYRVVGINTTVDSNGFVKRAPTLNSQADEYTARFNNWLESLNAGTLNGRATSASPTQDVLSGIPSGPISPAEVPIISFDGPMTGSLPRTANLWTCDDYIIVIYSMYTLTAPANESITLQGYLNGNTFLYDLIQPNQTRARSGNTYITLVPGDVFGINVLTGTGASDLTIQVMTAPLWLYDQTS